MFFGQEAYGRAYENSYQKLSIENKNKHFYVFYSKKGIKKEK